MNTFASFETTEARRHLTALCAHFGRKVAVNATDTAGWVQFPFGRCDMTADETFLTFCAEANDQDQLNLVVDVVTRHLERFAFRENPILVWQSTSTSTPTRKGDLT